MHNKLKTKYLRFIQLKGTRVTEKMFIHDLQFFLIQTFK